MEVNVVCVRALSCSFPGREGCARGENARRQAAETIGAGGRRLGLSLWLPSAGQAVGRVCLLSPSDRLAHCFARTPLHYSI